MAAQGNELLEAHINSDYKYGFTSNIEMDAAPKGLNEDIVRFISAKNSLSNSRQGSPHNSNSKNK